MRVLILGGGVIGACAARFLALAGAEPVVLERAEPAIGASGKSGGFLALDWCEGSPLCPLARRSFALHAELAEASPVDWGYRRVETRALGWHHAARGRATREPGLPDWLAADILPGEVLGTDETTAVIDPAAFTRAMLDQAVAAGGRVEQATATSLLRLSDGRVTGVVADGESRYADAVIVAMGPWSGRLAGLDLPPVYAIAGHSLIFGAESGTAEPLAFFVDHTGADGAMDGPEVVQRADGTVYVSGLSSQPAMPDDPAAVTPEAARAERLLGMIRDFAPGLAERKILARQCCFRPIMRDGLPIIGPVPAAPGAFVATGHSVWGMLNAPATGELLADLVTGQTPRVSPAAFSPDRPGLGR